MHLPYDLRSIDRIVLCRAGQTISGQKLDELAKASAPIRLVRFSETDLFPDLLMTFEDERYATILSPARVNREIVRHIRKVQLPETIIRELQKIKRFNGYTYRHILRTAVLAAKLCLDKHLPKTYDPAVIARLGLVHDLGKSRIPGEILDKATPLTLEEYAILKTHPLAGYILLHHYCGTAHRLYDYACYEHHERLDGSGYPRQVRKIKKYSQIIAVVDVLDALISSRPYRKEPYTMRAALDQLLDEATGGKLSRDLVLLLISQARKTKPSPRALRISLEKRDAPPRENMYGKILSGAPGFAKDQSLRA